MLNCSFNIHLVSECVEVEGNHVKGCSCTYGGDLSHTHTRFHVDDRCRELDRAASQRILDMASKEVARMPRWMRRDDEETVHDRLRNACWNLTDEQIEEVVKFAKEIG